MASSYTCGKHEGKPRGTEQDIQNAIVARGEDVPKDFKKSLVGLLTKHAIKTEGEMSEPVYRTVH